MEVFDLISVPNWLLCSVAALIASYFYVTKTFNFWKARGVKYIEPYPIIGTFGGYFTSAFQDEDVRRYKKYGKTFGTFEGSRPVLVCSDLDLLRDIFVKDFHIMPNRREMQFGDNISDNMVSATRDEQWKRIRTIITPAFTSGKMRRMFAVINNSADTTVENFLKEARKGTSVECKSLFGAFTMDVIASAAFGTKIDSHNDINNPLVAHARKVFTAGITWRFIMFIVCPAIMRKLKIPLFNPTVMQYFRDVVVQLVKERRKSGKSREDFLQLMIDSDKEIISKDEDDYTEYGHEEENIKVFQKAVSNKNLNHDEMVAQCVLFFIAGYDTTASTLSFVLHNLALNPDCQEKLIQEIDEAYKTHKEIDYEVLNQLKYLDHVINETLRLYPAAIRTDRVLEEDYKLGGESGIDLPKGTVIAVPIYAIHHDGDIYPDPEKFDPERFTPENKSSRHSYSYLPFGAGPRNCIGMRFAIMEIKICLVKLFRNLKFSVSPETKIPMEFFRGFGLLSPKGVYLKAQIRDDV